MSHNYNFKRSSLGFTLIEMIMVITLMGIVGVITSNLIGRQMANYQDTTIRQTLVSSAEQAIEFIARDLRMALPNSIRVDATNQFIEYVPVHQAGRYRAVHGSHANSNILDFSSADNQFQVIGHLSTLPPSARIVINNTGAEGVAGLNIYGGASVGPTPAAGSHVITPSATTVSFSTDAFGDLVSISPPFQFSGAAVSRKFQIVNFSRTFNCGSFGGDLVRYSNYAIQNNQPVDISLAPLSSATEVLVVSSVNSCSFEYANNDFLGSGLVTVSIELTSDGESIRLSKQIQVVNSL